MAKHRKVSLASLRAFYALRSVNVKNGILVMEKDGGLLRLRETVIATAIKKAEDGEFDTVMTGISIVERLDHVSNIETGIVPTQDGGQNVEPDSATDRFLKEDHDWLECDQEEALEKEWRTAEELAKIFVVHPTTIRKASDSFKTKPSKTKSGKPLLIESLSYVMHYEQRCRECFKENDRCQCS